ncbi:hypothetical protein [Streptosporangium sp. NPDC048865]|uniref:hypothetical protein n=1 Tax=Streptosporangium sp. NPDC048865 TaxID=3155766 RepID=UPI003436B44F
MTSTTNVPHDRPPAGRKQEAGDLRHFFWFLSGRTQTARPGDRRGGTGLAGIASEAS